MGKKINGLDQALTVNLTDEIEVSQAPHSAGTSKKAQLSMVKAIFSDVKVASAYWDSTIILAMNSTPQSLGTPAAGKFIHIEDVIAETDGGTTPYDTNVKLRFGNHPSSGAAKAQTGLDKFLEAPYALKVRGVPITCDDGITVGAQYVVNADLMAWVDVGDPLNGDANVAVTIFYREVTPQV